MLAMFRQFRLAVVSSNITILMALDKWEFRTMLKLSRTNTHNFCYIFSSKITKNVSHFSIAFFRETQFIAFNLS